MLNLLYIFLGIVVVKFVMNFANLIQCSRYLARYEQYIKEPTWGFVEHKHHIVKLLKGADVSDSTVALVEPVGFGLIRRGQVSVQENITATRKDVVGLSIEMLHDAIGVYRSRMSETFNPLYWIEFIIHLPKQTLRYLGAAPESVVIKIAQLVYWAVSVILCFLFALFRPEIETLIKGWLTRLTP